MLIQDDQGVRTVNLETFIAFCITMTTVKIIYITTYADSFGIQVNKSHALCFFVSPYNYILIVCFIFVNCKFWYFKSIPRIGHKVYWKKNNQTRNTHTPHLSVVSDWLFLLKIPVASFLLPTSIRNSFVRVLRLHVGRDLNYLLIHAPQHHFYNNKKTFTLRMIQKNSLAHFQKNAITRVKARNTVS